MVRKLDAGQLYLSRLGEGPHAVDHDSRDTEEHRSP